LTPEEFDSLFDSFRISVIRLETLPAYDVGGAEGVRLRAFREGRPRPERSVRTDPWLARIAATTMNGRSWSRTRVVDEPLTEYQRCQLVSYAESQAVGEQVRLVRRSEVVVAGGDFWLFDAGSEHAHAVLMTYDRDGRWLGAEPVADPAAVGDLHRRVDAISAEAVSLNEFLATVRG
jgi:hypothetical protein